jgi:TolB protein
MSADGSNQRDISSHLVERARQAHWGSNGLIVVAYRDNNDTEAGIGIIDPDEDSFTPLYWQPNIGGRPEWPKWSPDCSEIAFAREVDKNWEVYKMNIDEGSLTNLTNDPSIDGSPDWSPDGNYLLFKSYRSGSCDLHLMDKDGAYIGILTDDSGRETDPSFSPNGEYIIFTRFRFLYDPSQIYLTELMNAGDVNKWIQLTTKGASCYPAWKPKKEDLNFN